LARDAERVLARRNYVNGWTRAEKHRHELGADGDDVLAVVEKHEEPPRRERRGERARERAVGLLANAEGFGERERHRVGIAGRGELDEPNAVAKIRERAPAHL